MPLSHFHWPDFAAIQVLDVPVFCAWKSTDFGPDNSPFTASTNSTLKASSLARSGIFSDTLFAVSPAWKTSLPSATTLPSSPFLFIIRTLKRACTGWFEGRLRPTEIRLGATSRSQPLNPMLGTNGDSDKKGESNPECAVGSQIQLSGKDTCGVER